MTVVNPLYILTIAVISAIPYAILVSALPNVYILIVTIAQIICALILIYFHSKKLLRQPLVLLPKDKTIVVLLGALAPIFGIIAYCIFLRSTPGITRSVFVVGVQVFLQCILFSIIFAAVLPLFPNPTQPHTWTTKQAEGFRSYITTIEKDVDAISANSQKQDVASTRSACVKLGSDLAQGNTLAAFPKATIQSKLESGLAEINNASVNCLKGIDEGDTEASKKFASQILSGYARLNEAIQAMKQD